MSRKLLVAVIVVAAVLGGLIYAKLDQFSALGDAAAAMQPPVLTVTAAEVIEAQWEQVIDATASVSAVQGVTVGTEVGGRVTEIAFASGQAVAQGQVLLRLDTSIEDAQLASAEAAAALAKTALARVHKLGKRDHAADDAIDRAEAKVKETAAQRALISAQIAKKTVRAPFAGRLGLRLVNLGQILSEGEPVVVLQSMDPVYVDFSVPQHQLARLRPELPVRVLADVAPGEVFNGEIIAVNPEVDARTRNVRARALVANPGERLRVGMFATAEVVLPESRTVLAVPATAIRYAPYGDSVFVIETQANEQSGEMERVLRQRFVRLGQSRGDFVDVIEGLKPGERVVTSGVFKLHAGARVDIDNTLAPAAELKPSPANS